MGAADPRREFLILVDRMRTAQKEYFRFRTGAKLELSRNLEREVDEILRITLAPATLFPMTDDQKEIR